MTRSSETELDEPLEEQLMEASRLAENGEEARAFQLLLGLEAEHPENATLLCMLGVLAAHTGAEGMAADFFRRCLAQQPMDPELLVRAGAGLAALSDPEAEPALRLAALTAPEMVAARMHYGSYLVRTGMLGQGLEELGAARELDPDDPVVRRELGIAFLLAGRAVEALAQLEEAEILASDDVDIRLVYGLALIQEEELDTAAEVLHALGTSLPHSGEVQAILALLFRLSGWEEEAWIAFSRAEAAAEALDPAWLTDIEEALGGDEEAVRSLLLDEVAPSVLRDRLIRT